LRRSLDHRAEIRAELPAGFLRMRQVDHVTGLSDRDLVEQPLSPRRQSQLAKDDLERVGERKLGHQVRRAAVDKPIDQSVDHGIDKLLGPARRPRWAERPSERCAGNGDAPAVHRRQRIAECEPQLPL
jgi:hypothetical protein